MPLCSAMEKSNNVTVFILLELSKNKNIEILCFVTLFLFCYISVWVGNLLRMISITSSKLVDPPMYFFLNYLSLSNLWETSTVTPKLMTDFLTERETISYRNCTTQVLMTHFFGGTDTFIPTGWPMTVMLPSSGPCTTPSS